VSCSPPDHVSAILQGAGAWRLPDFPQQIRRSAQRHHPANRRVAERLRLPDDEHRRDWTRLVNHHRQHQLHQSHPGLPTRRWKPGEWICSSGCCPANCRSSNRKSTAAFLRMVRIRTSATGPAGEGMSVKFRRAVQRQGAHGQPWRWWAATYVNGVAGAQQPTGAASLAVRRVRRLWPRGASPNVTNGVTPQALIAVATPSLPACSNEAIGATGA